MTCVLTVDVEDWYQTNDFNNPIEKYDSFEDRIVPSTEELLDLLGLYQTKATFFVLGCVAKKHPDLIRRIAAEGHEIGSHSYYHRLIGGLSPAEFREDIRNSKLVLEELTGQKVELYRAPSWSISRNTFWALEILEDEGFKYDSSLQPFATPLSGISKAPTAPYYPIIGGKALSILEFPPSVFELGPLRIPFAGGFYLRVMPYCLIRQALVLVSQERPALVYCHPWELDVGQKRLDVPLHIKLAHYYNLHTTKGKLERLLQDFRFVPLRDFVRGKEFPVLPL